MPASAAVENGRTKLQVHGTALAALSFQAIGIIYADLGTSPLYTLNGLWPTSGPVPPEEDVIGGISAIIWALTILPLIKYVIISLEFGTHAGEGGTFALFQGLYPTHVPLPEHSLSLQPGEKYVTAKRDPPRRARWPLLLWSLLGTALTLADGVFTPAVSVTSAVGGIAVANPSVSEYIVPISIAFLLVLFLVQPLGTHRLATAFAPLMIIWFMLIGAIGIYNISTYPAIFRALDPSRAVMLFVRTGDYDILSGVVLALTGCEAMFANLGQFNALSIRISFSTIIYPSLVLAYLGQGARLVTEGEAVLSNLFYTTIPGGSNGPLFWIVYVFAVLACLIASQTLITATFSLVQQLVNMDSFPPLRIVNTSDFVQGQVYLPMANWLLMIATIAVVGAFKDLAALTHAFGFSVATVMFVTTALVAVQMYYIKAWPAVVSIAFFITFGFFDGLFWGATFKKVPQGAWVALMIGAILYSVMLLWTWAKGLENKFDSSHKRDLWEFIQTGPSDDSKTEHPADDTESITSASTTNRQACYYLSKVDVSDSEVKGEVYPLERVETCAIFHNSAGEHGVPHSFVGFIQQWPALPRVIVFLSTQVLPVAHVGIEDQYLIRRIHAHQLFYSCIHHRGFRDEALADAPTIVDRIDAYESTSDADPDVRRRAATVKLIRACARRSTHVVPHYNVVSAPVQGRGAFRAVQNFLRAFLVEGVYRRVATMFAVTREAENTVYVGVNAGI